MSDIEEIRRYEVKDVRFVRPDVALAYKEDGRWLIMARQNTLVPR